MLNKILTTLSVLCISWAVHAHQPDISSTMLVEQGENKWVLQVRAALTAFEYEVENHFGKNSYATPKEFQELVLQHLQENISIQINETEIAKLNNGLVKLGHETSATFAVIGVPKNIEALVIKNSSFSNISRNQSALIVLKEDFEKDQFTLNNKNEHTVQLNAYDAKFVIASPSSNEKANYLPILILAGAFGALLILYFALKNKQIFRFNSPLQNA